MQWTHDGAGSDSRRTCLQLWQTQLSWNGAKLPRRKVILATDIKLWHYAWKNSFKNKSILVLNSLLKIDLKSGDDAGKTPIYKLSFSGLFMLTITKWINWQWSWGWGFKSCSGHQLADQAVHLQGKINWQSLCFWWMAYISAFNRHCTHREGGNIILFIKTIFATRR